jgi:4'-phosphopantetheinyl transferase EntD
MDREHPAIIDGSLAVLLSEFAGAPVFVAGGGFTVTDSPYPQEQQLVANAVASRRAEFFSGRHFARSALHHINCLDAPILRGEKGNPLWPENVLGSISHDLGQVIVAVMAASSHRGIGIDLVLDSGRVDSSLEYLIARPDELNSLSQVAADVQVLALAFSLKESVVKAISPTIDCYLDFMDIDLSLKHGRLNAYLKDFDVTLPCGFTPLPNGLLSFALLEKQ